MTNKIWVIGDLNFEHTPWGPDKQAAEREEAFFIQYNDVVRKNDIAIFLGNIAVKDTVYWLKRLQELPGSKALFLGDKDKNRSKWYGKFGFDVLVEFNDSRVIPTSVGNVLVSHLPAFNTEGMNISPNLHGLVAKFGRAFDRNNCILSVHGHTLGSGKTSHRTYDVSAPIPMVKNLDQIIHEKFKQ